MNDEHGELLMELVQSPYWAAVKEEVAVLHAGAVAKLTAQADGLMDLVKREGYAAQARAYRLVVDVVEDRARKHMKRISGDID